MADMGVNEDMQPDKFYFDQALKVFARQQPSQSPVFMFVYLTANHFPWTDVYRPDLTPPEASAAAPVTGLVARRPPPGRQR